MASTGNKAEGLQSLIGEYVQLWCLNYIYSGKLVDVNDSDVALTKAVVVFETGALTDKVFKTFDPVAADTLFVKTQAIESYCLAPQMVK